MIGELKTCELVEMGSSFMLLTRRHMMPNVESLIGSDCLVQGSQLPLQVQVSEYKDLAFVSVVLLLHLSLPHEILLIYAIPASFSDCIVQLPDLSDLLVIHPIEQVLHSPFTLFYLLPCFSLPFDPLVHVASPVIATELLTIDLPLSQEAHYMQRVLNVLMSTKFGFQICVAKNTLLSIELLSVQTQKPSIEWQWRQ
jgi:hypothetical protein